MKRQPEAAAGGPNPSAEGPGEEAGKIARGLLGTQGDNSHTFLACGIRGRHLPYQRLIADNGRKSHARKTAMGKR